MQRLPSGVNIMRGIKRVGSAIHRAGRSAMLPASGRGVSIQGIRRPTGQWDRMVSIKPASSGMGGSLKRINFPSGLRSGWFQGAVSAFSQGYGAEYVSAIKREAVKRGLSMLPKGASRKAAVAWMKEGLADVKSMDSPGFKRLEKMLGYRTIRPAARAIGAGHENAWKESRAYRNMVRAGITGMAYKTSLNMFEEGDQFGPF